MVECQEKQLHGEVPSENEGVLAQYLAFQFKGPVPCREASTTIFNKISENSFCVAVRWKPAENTDTLLRSPHIDLLS